MEAKRKWKGGLEACPFADEIWVLLLSTHAGGNTISKGKGGESGYDDLQACRT